MKFSDKSSSPSVIETLESRIAPATVLTYTDVDGDLVKITASKGNLAGHATFSEVGTGQQLLLLDLTDRSFADTSLTFTVKRVAGGDGLAHVGKINAAGNDLGKVVVRGDLGEIDAGDGNAGTPAIKSLTALSMGVAGGTDGATATETQRAAWSELLGNSLLNIPGTLSSLLGQLSGLQGLGELSSTASRTLATLGADLQALLATATDESGGPLSGGHLTSTATEILENLSQSLAKVAALPLADQGLLGLLPALLLSLEAKLEVALGGADLVGANGAANLGINLPGINLPGINLPGLLPGITLPGIELPILPIGGVLEGLLNLNLGSLPTILVDTLGDLGDGLSNLLAAPTLLGTLPATVQALLGDASAALETVLGGSGTLSPGLLRDLASLQSHLASLTGLAGANPSFLDGGLVNQLATLNGFLVDTFQNLTGGSAEVAAASSDIMGNVNFLKVRGNVSNVFLNIHGNVGEARIGGALSGGSETNGGELHVSGNLKFLRLGGSLVGGDALNSGSIQVGGAVGRMVIRGSVIGGSDTHTGAVALASDVGSILVRGDLAGHEGIFSGSITNVNGTIKALEVRGSVIGADVDSSAAISATDEIGTLRIRKGVWGDADHGVAISAGGKLTQTGKNNYAFRDIRIGGPVEFASVLAGYSAELEPVNGSAQVRTLAVGGDWHASSFSAGIDDQAAAGFGDSGDKFIEPRNTSIISSIASIQIRGAVSGTVEGNDGFGFVAGSIGKFTLGTATLKLTAPTVDNHALAQGTGDVTVREISAVSNPV